MDRAAGRAGTAVVCALLLVTLLAGCTGSPSGAGPANASDGGDAGPAGPDDSRAGTGSGTGAADGTAYAFTGPAASAVRWMNGSFAPHEACVPTGCVASIAMGERTFEAALDLSEDVPAGPPTRIEAELTFENTATGAVSMLLRTGDDVEVVRSSNSVDHDAQTGRLEALVLKAEGGAVEVVLRYHLADADDEMTYELRAAVEADPAVVPERVPVAFEHPGGGADVRFVPAGGDSGAGDGGADAGGEVRLLLWDPDDAFLGRVPLDGSEGYTVPLAGPAGTYVAYPVSAGDGVRVVVPADAEPSASTELRALGVATTRAEGRDAPPTGEVQWSFTLDQVPLGVGIWAGGSTAYEMTDVAGEVVSPEGVVLSFESSGIQGGFSLGGTAMSQWWSIGSEAMVPGEYAATFSSTSSANVQVGELVVDYVR